MKFGRLMQCALASALVALVWLPGGAAVVGRTSAPDLLSTTIHLPLVLKGRPMV